MGVVFGTEGVVSIGAEVGRAAKTGGRATDAPTKMFLRTSKTTSFHAVEL